MIAEDDPDYLADVGAIVVAAYPFEAENEDELSVEEGARLRTLELQDEWWLAELEDGSKSGLIPVSYVVSVEAWDKMVRVAQYGYDVDDADLAELPDAYNGSDSADDSTGNRGRENSAENQLEERGLAAGTENVTAPAPLLPPPPSAAEATLQALQAEEKAAREATQVEPVGKVDQAAQEVARKAAEDAATAASEYVEDDEFAMLSAKFAALQERVANVKLTVDTEPVVGEEAETGHAPSLPPPPSPAEAAAALAGGSGASSVGGVAGRGPPPSPAQAAASFGLAKQAAAEAPPPAPPSPHIAAAALEQRRLEEARHRAEEEQRLAHQERLRLEEERARILAAEEQSKQRAAELRAKRTEEAARQREAMERERAERAEVERFVSRKGRAEQEGKASMHEAIEAVKRAVAADNSAQHAAAYAEYVRALELFSNVLSSGVLQPQHAVIVERMKGYLDRMSTLEPLICEGVWSDGKALSGRGSPVKRYKDRVKVLLVMARSGHLAPVPFGDELQLRARLANSQGDYRSAFRAYSEALEYYMAYHKLQQEKGKATEKAVMDGLVKMLDAAEGLKSKIPH